MTTTTRELLDRLVEAGARAICRENGADPDADSEPYGRSPSWRLYAGDSRAALLASFRALHDAYSKVRNTTGFVMDVELEMLIKELDK